MDQFGPWIELGNYLPEALLKVPPPDYWNLEPVVQHRIHDWERQRLGDDVEWSFVMLANGEAFERRGIQSRASFSGFTRRE